VNANEWAGVIDYVEADDAIDTAPQVTTIIADPIRKHIVLCGPDLAGHAQPVVFADLGSTLHLWTGQGCVLDPELALKLAGHLAMWAQGKRGE
jgi:hypothetical protein